MISQYCIFIKNWLRMLINLKFDNHIVMCEKDIYFIKYFPGNLNKWYWYKIHFQILTSNKYRKLFFMRGELHREDGPAVIREDGTKAWYQNGKSHRVNGPAVIREDGAKFWYINGKYHRKDGPAIELINGTKKWYLNNKRHREDGPAQEFSDGTKKWYLNGKKYSEKEFNSILISKLPKLNINFN